MRLLAARAMDALGALKRADQANWELHVVAHSAGSIVAAHALERLLTLGATLKSVQFMAPAATVQLFKSKVLPLMNRRPPRARCPQPTLYVLSDVGELDDDLGPYGKSLLYLVSNAFEEERGTPILGMERFISDVPSTLDTAKRDVSDLVLTPLFKKTVDGLPSLVVAGVTPTGTPFERLASSSTSDSHGGFDNDPATLNAVSHPRPRADAGVHDARSAILIGDGGGATGDRTGSSCRDGWRSRSGSLGSGGGATTSRAPRA
jgi:hypothetical protein